MPEVNISDAINEYLRNGSQEDSTYCDNFDLNNYLYESEEY